MLLAYATLLIDSLGKQPSGRQVCSLAPGAGQSLTAEATITLEVSSRPHKLCTHACSGSIRDANLRLGDTRVWTRAWRRGLADPYAVEGWVSPDPRALSLLLLKRYCIGDGSSVPRALAFVAQTCRPFLLGRREPL